MDSIAVWKDTTDISRAKSMGGARLDSGAEKRALHVKLRNLTADDS